MGKHYELVILGGGCAGLSLAMRLADFGHLAPTTLILEKRAGYSNDRTWCFWNEGNPVLSDWVDHSWSNFQIKNGNNSFTKSCKDAPYLMISANTFYRKAISKIALNKQRLTLMKNQNIVSVVKTHAKTWRITTEECTFTTDKIVDTRPSKSINEKSSTLWQSFIGYEIEAQANIFDKNQFVLMDFDERFTHGLGFIYVLPFSESRALIEYTVFSDKVMSADRLKHYLNPALKKYLKDASYQTLRKEQGQLPMGNQKIKQSGDPSYIYAGLYAGSARPSSGYAFQRIQSWAEKCVTEIINHQPMMAPEKDVATLTIMDDIFLSVLRSNAIKENPNATITLFFNFFSRCRTKTVIRFLSDHANSMDYLSIIIAMPKLLFLKALPAYALKRLCNLKND
jgi:lycopene beta-cyclase